MEIEREAVLELKVPFWVGVTSTVMESWRETEIMGLTVRLTLLVVSSAEAELGRVGKSMRLSSSAKLAEDTRANGRPKDLVPNKYPPPQWMFDMHMTS